MGVYCTAWTFYGSVGLPRARAWPSCRSTSDRPWLPCCSASWSSKMLRITKAQRITSIADFIAARYGKSALLAGLVTVVAVASAIPYIALQLKAVAASVTSH